MRSLLDSVESTDFAWCRSPSSGPSPSPKCCGRATPTRASTSCWPTRLTYGWRRWTTKTNSSMARPSRSAYASRADLLVYFYARALQILRPDGRLSFITSNSFTRRKYGEKLRRHLPIALTIERVIDFGEAKIFDATVEPYVLIGQKQASGTE